MQGSPLIPFLVIMIQERTGRLLSHEANTCGMSSNNNGEQTRTARCVGGTEGGVQEARTENEPREDRSDVGWSS